MEKNETGPVYCLRHPKTETRLKCASCGAPVCPKCMVTTEVGMKCPDCVRKLKTHLEIISPAQYLFGILAGLGSSLAGALVAGLLLPLGGLLVSILGGMGLGYGVSQAIFYSTGRKLGKRVQLIAALSVAVGFLLIGWFVFPFWIFSVLYWVTAVAAVVSALYYLK